MEELDFQGLLDRFRRAGFQKGEQVILANFGTNQTLLSVIFQEPANVKNITIDETDGEIIRNVDLVAGEKTVGHATTHIPRDRNSEPVWEAVRARQLGLGQIIVTYCLPTKRVLVDVGRDDEAFWRTYNIEGPEVFFEINEYYPRVPFEAIGWTHKKGSLMTITDEESKVLNFSKFVAIGVQQDSGIFRAIEDEYLTNHEALGIMLEGAEVLGEIASGLMSSQKKEEED